MTVFNDNSMAGSWASLRSLFNKNVQMLAFTVINAMKSHNTHITKVLMLYSGGGGGGEGCSVWGVSLCREKKKKKILSGIWRVLKLPQEAQHGL